MADLRERKPPKAATAEARPRTDPSTTSKAKRNVANEEPNIWLLSIAFVLFTGVVGSFLWYKVDSRENGPFAAWVDSRSPLVSRIVNGKSPPWFGVAAEETSGGGLQLTEAELSAYTGEDPDKPIYLAINGIIFDVSASPAFYGPGGHYHHFVGKDATRAWISECWDEPEQFTWRLDGVEEMFSATWLDEQIEDAGHGIFAEGSGIANMPPDMLREMGKKLMTQFGTVTDGEKARRRIEDKTEADAKVQESLAHWVKFFEGNAKYQTVGKVVRDESRPTPPKLCEAALKKKPIKGGKLQALMSTMGDIGGQKKAQKEEEKAGMPDWVRDKTGKEDELIEEVVVGGDDDDADAHDEL